MNTRWMRRRWLDFRYGHATYLIFLLSFSNFILIFHRLLIEQVDFLDNLFSELWLFVIVFVLLYIPVAIVVGIWHRKNQIKIDADVWLLNNPLMLRIFNTIIDLQTGKASKEDVESLQKYLRSVNHDKADQTKD